MASPERVFTSSFPPALTFGSTGTGSAQNQWSEEPKATNATQGWTTGGLIHFVHPTGTVVNSLSILRFACIHPPASGNAMFRWANGRGPLVGRWPMPLRFSPFATKRSITMCTAERHRRSAASHATAFTSPLACARLWERFNQERNSRFHIFP